MIRVEINHERLAEQSNGQGTWTNINAIGQLQKAGIPVEGGIGLRGVTHGKLVMFNEMHAGKRICVYEWTPGEDTPASPYVSDDEI